MQSPSRNRVPVLVAAVVLFALLVALSLFDLQVRRSEQFQERVARQHRGLIEVDGHRGAVLDRAGRELAVSVTTESLYAHPGRLNDADKAARLLAPVLGVPYSRVLAQLRSDRPFEWLARRLDPRTAQSVKALADQGLEVGKGLPIDFQEEPRRFNPQGGLAVHVVGFANIDQRGVEGIEKRFDDVLQGDSASYLALRDGRGGNFLQLVRRPSREPLDVVLTLDMVLQHIVERELDRVMSDTGALAATAILLDPRNGQVLAMANRPTPDPANYGASTADARRNRAVTDLYEPGSTFKMVTAATALDLGAISPDQRFSCSPVTIGRHVYRDVHEHGVLSVREILEESSNNGAIRIGLTLSKAALRDGVVRFGFGHRTGIELPGERAGRVTPTARMSEQSRASIAMGYEVAVTPLQVASAFAAIANGGVAIPPRVVLGTRETDGAFTPAPRPDPQRVVSPQTARSMSGMLEGVVVRGTGKAAAVPGYRVAGKTGTAKKIVPGRGYSTNEYFSSFAAFGPLREPRLVGLLVLDTPRRGQYYGGLTAAPSIGRILADAFAYLGVSADDDPWEARREILEARASSRKSDRRTKPKASVDRPETAPDVVAAPTGPDQIPDLSGRSLREAVAIASARGCRVRAVGSGVVIRQSPAPGSAIASGSVCEIGLGEPPEEDETAALVAKSEAPRSKARPSRGRRR